MKVMRLPGIHHDSSCVIVSGSERTVLIDAGTSWYQANVEERIRPHLEGRPDVAQILLSHRHSDTAAGAVHLASAFDATIHASEKAVNALAGGDLFTTWASRFASTMPPMEVTPFGEDEAIDLGDDTLRVVPTPGHTSGSVSFYIEGKRTLIAGDTIPAAGFPARTDMPTGSLVELCDSLAHLRGLGAEMLIPGRGEAIVGANEVDAVLARHEAFAKERRAAGGEVPADWPRPAETCSWLSPEPAWD